MPLHLPGEPHLARCSLARLERLLGYRFVRVHRSAIVRKDAITELSPRTHGDYDVQLEGGAVLPLCRS